MVEWIREGSLAWVIVNNGPFHFPRRSPWRVASTTGWDASLGTPELKFALDRARIQVPILRQENGAVVETQVLQAKNLEGICLALTGSATKLGSGIGGRQDALTTLIFGDKLGFGSILPTAINAVAFVDGMSTNWGDFAGAGVEIVYYNLVCKSAPNSLGK